MCNGKVVGDGKYKGSVCVVYVKASAVSFQRASRM